MPKPTFEEAKAMLESVRDGGFISGQTLEQMKGVDRRTCYGKHINRWYRRKRESVDNLICEKAALIAGGSIVDGKFVAEGSEHHD